jgi:UDP-N-acetyl-D-galactosamine dehydrogenase
MAHNRKISVIGLGYVGLPVAVAFGEQNRVVGFDSDAGRVKELAADYDRTREVSAEALGAADVLFTSEPEQLRSADFHIVAVPTPIDDAKQPDLGPLRSASRAVGSQLKKGDIVVFESTVYPGATEEECVPELERASGLSCGEHFRVGYSPERINPGDRDHSFRDITKVVSGQDDDTLRVVAEVYGSVVNAGVHRASSIKVAEAAKVIENTQRDLNIALMNELALIFQRMDIDTRDVLAAASSKWNFLPFTPGLVGGHCIGVDPYYLTHKATTLDYYPQVILAGRRINDGMGAFVAAQVIKKLIHQGRTVKDSVVTVLGLTFKENVADLRNTRVIDIVRELADYGLNVQVSDPLADTDEAKREYDVTVTPLDGLDSADCIVLAVAHTQYVQGGWELVRQLLSAGDGVVFDIQGVLPRESKPEGVSLWRL